MADGESFHKESHLALEGTTSFSQLLFSNDDDVIGLDMGQTFHCSSTGKPPKMLCFGDYGNEGELALFSEATKTTPQIFGVTCRDSSPASSANNNNNNSNSVNISTMSNPIRKRNGSSQVPMQCTSTVAKTPLATQKTSKKTKTGNPTMTAAHSKVRKEKLGDRITALQQLVSPFGKTDTASVLHEAIGYIRFLHDQVQVLCSPYLQHLPESLENGEEEESSRDLRSRGLCLVPVECTVHVASSNGADFWSPAMGNNFSSSSSSSTKQ